jgi:NAD+-dependent protein deacetylase sirtuin 4
VDRLVHLYSGRSFLVLSGAGCSTESGIPDYRGPKAVPRTRGPMTYQEFVADAAGRQRYWARAVRGWPRFRDAEPNAAHCALARLEAAGAVQAVVTQNVDRLHQRAGSRRVVELHGSLAEVVCLACRAQETRRSVHRRMLHLNGLEEAPGGDVLPDGDAQVGAAEVAGFRVADCLACGGVLKPRVVFFGENVPRPVHDASTALLEAAQALLIVGSSLTVYSGYRFLRRASQRGIPIGLVNLGAPHRGLDRVDVHVNAHAGEALRQLSDALEGVPAYSANPPGNDQLMLESVPKTDSPRGRSELMSCGPVPTSTVPTT